MTTLAYTVLMGDTQVTGRKCRKSDELNGPRSTVLSKIFQHYERNGHQIPRPSIASLFFQ